MRKLHPTIWLTLIRLLLLGAILLPMLTVLPARAQPPTTPTGSIATLTLPVVAKNIPTTFTADDLYAFMDAEGNSRNIMADCLWIFADNGPVSPQQYKAVYCYWPHADAAAYVIFYFRRVSEDGGRLHMKVMTKQ